MSGLAAPGQPPGQQPGAGLRQRLARLSMRSRLLLGILLPVGLLVSVDSYSVYHQALRAADTAYDRTLLASAKAIGELLDVAGTPDAPRLLAAVPYSALEAFEADNRSRIYFKITGFQGEMVSGFEALPSWRGTLPDRGIYAALVDFYDDHYQGIPVRVAVLLQPVAGTHGLGLATIQVAETLELRQTLARQVLTGTLWRQAGLLALIGAVVWVVVQLATRPVRTLSAAIQARAADDLSPINLPQAPRELQPLVQATNEAMARQARLLAHQRRFVRDASHQLRTPLAVLKTQVQSARRGDLPPMRALQEIGETVDGATRLANQMLALAKVEQVRQQGTAPLTDWADAVRDVALDLAPLIADAQLDFELISTAAPVRADAWALRELTRNLLHNALRHCPVGGRLCVSMATTPAAAGTSTAQAWLTIADSGPGVPATLLPRLMQPFSPGLAPGGTGLGLAICRDIVLSLGGQLALQNRLVDGMVAGLDAKVWLPLVDNLAAPQHTPPTTTP